MSKGLFEADGRPMGKRYSVFAMAECPRFEEIRAVVEGEGGVLKTIWQQGAIHLANVDPKALLPFPKPQDHSVFSYHFVVDSQNLGELQDKALYEVGKEQCSEEVEEDPVPKKEFKSRSKFTQREEEAMRAYMNKYPGPFTSVSYWVKATAYGLPVKRSADTLRDHYKRMLKGKTATDHLQDDHPKRDTKSPTKRPRLTEPAQHHISLAKPSSPGRVSIAAIQSSSPAKSVPVSISAQRTTSPRVAIRTISKVRSPVSGSRMSTPMQRASESAISDLVNTPLSLSSRFENTPKLLVTVTHQRGRVVQDMDALKRKCLVENIPEKFQSLVQRCQQRSRHPIEESDVLEALLKANGNAERTEEYFALN